MTFIGILTCSNTSQDIGCSSSACFHAAYEKDGTFAAYGDEVRIAGVINCAGCPGRDGHDKILRRVSALTASGVQAIHLSSCMTKWCPFVAKYESAIKAAHPEVAVVRGTHAPLPERIMARLETMVHDELTRPGMTVQQMGQAIRRELQG